jgi:hypothetical protein
MFKISKSLAIIVAVVAVAAGGTYSFSKSTQVLGAGTTASQTAMGYGMATIGIGATTGFPMYFDNMVPGNEYSSPATIEYTGTANGDLYFGATFTGGHDYLGNILEVAIEKVDGNGANQGWATGWMSPEGLYTGWTNLASNVSPNAVLRYKVHVRVKSDADNTYQGKIAYNGVVIHAVQTGVPAPGTAPKDINPDN